MQNKCDCRKISGKSDFTLIELLVVIAIIAILASILMPALSMARARGKTSNCTNNLKSIASSFGQYANDYDDYITPHRVVAKDIDGVTSALRWPIGLVRLKYLPATTLLKFSTSPRYPEGVLKCPAEDRDQMENSSGTLMTGWNTWKASHYGRADFYGGYYAGVSTNVNRYFLKITELKMPSKNADVGDKGTLSKESIGSALEELQIAGRHNESLNIAFADQHVELRAIDTIPNATSLPGDYYKFAFWSRKDQAKYWWKFPL